jgi:hypothetical protein
MPSPAKRRRLSDSLRRPSPAEDEREITLDNWDRVHDARLAQVSSLARSGKREVEVHVTVLFAAGCTSCPDWEWSSEEILRAGYDPNDADGISACVTDALGDLASKLFAHGATLAVEQARCDASDEGVDEGSVYLLEPEVVSVSLCESERCDDDLLGGTVVLHPALCGEVVGHAVRRARALQTAVCVSVEYALCIAAKNAKTGERFNVKTRTSSSRVFNPNDDADVEVTLRSFLRDVMSGKAFTKAGCLYEKLGMALEICNEEWDAKHSEVVSSTFQSATLYVLPTTPSS